MTAPVGDVRARLTPQMATYDRIGAVWAPYVMFLQAPDYRSAVVNTDRHGLRANVAPGGASFGLDDLDGTPFNAIFGGSTAFGVGATGDGHALGAQLTMHSELRWLNFGGRAYNIMQEFLLYCLLRHRLAGLKRIVVFSAVNDLTIAAMNRTPPADFGGFFLWDHYQRTMGDSELSYKRRILRALLGPFADPESDFARLDLSDVTKFLAGRPLPKKPRLRMEAADTDKTETAVDRIAHTLANWNALALADGTELIYVMQPFASWLNREPVPEETALFAHLDTLPHNQFRVMKEEISAPETYQRYAGLLRQRCAALGIKFLDLNEMLSNKRLDGEWLFADRVHMTDRGYAVTAETIGAELGG